MGVFHLSRAGDLHSRPESQLKDSQKSPQLNQAEARSYFLLLMVLLFGQRVFQQTGSGSGRSILKLHFALATRRIVSDTMKNIALYEQNKRKKLLLILKPGSKQTDTYNTLTKSSYHTGCFLHWASLKKLKYGKPRLGESTLT